MCSLKFRVKSGGKIVDGKWVWEPVVWEKCSCGISHSNRSIPDSFWNQKWEKPKNGKSSAGVLLWKEYCGRKKFLLVQSYGNLYGIPKGKIEDGESFFDGALREFYEETGTNLEIDYNDFFEVRKCIGRDRTSIYIAKVPWNFNITSVPKSDVEISSFGFVDSNILGRYKINNFSKNILSKLQK